MITVPQVVVPDIATFAVLVVHHVHVFATAAAHVRIESDRISLAMFSD